MPVPVHATAPADAPARRSYLLRAADQLATAMATYGIPLLILATTGSGALTGLAYLVEWVPRLAVFTVVGTLVDRHGPHDVFRLANAARTVFAALTMAALCALPGSGAAGTVVVLSFCAMAGVTAQASFLAAEAIGSAHSQQSLLQAHRVQSVQIAIDQGALITGPLLGGVLLLAGPSALLAAIAAASLAAVGGSVGWHPPTAATTVTAPATSFARSLGAGLRTVARRPALIWLVVGLAASNLALAVIESSAPITVMQHFGHTSAMVGAVWSVGAALSLLGLAACGRIIDRWGLWAVGAMGAAVVCLGSLTTALAPGFAVYTAGVALLLGADAVMTVVLRTLRARLIPPRGSGATLSVTIVAVLLPFPVAGALVAAAPAAGLPVLLSACALVQITVLAAAFAGLRRHRADLAAPVEPLRLVPPHANEPSPMDLTPAA
ncbi:MFS transporter [Streptomyces lydicus]